VKAQAGDPGYEKRALAGVAVIAACIVGFYFFISHDIHRPFWFAQGKDNYYPLLAEGFQAGHLWLPVDPPPALAKLSDPYDPAQRQQAGLADLHDVSYFHGRYYLYFGVAPVLTVFLPFRVLTGSYFPQELATILFCIGGYFCSLALFLGFRRRYFPDTSAGWLWLGALMLGMANLCPAMLARNAVWEVPIASAYFYSCLGLLLLFKASGSGRRLLWLAMAGLAFGLSVASRPHFVFLGIMLGLFWLWDWRRRAGAGEHAGPILRETAALFLPIAVVVAGLLVYNDARFGDPLEFGVRYQLGGIDTLHLKPMSVRFLPINFYYYFLAPAQFQRYFPFVTVIRGYFGSRPADYLGIEDPYGILPNLPCFWLAFLTPWIWACRGRQHSQIGRWLALLGLCFAGVATLTLSFGAANNRYMVDFLPTLLLIAALGLLMLGRRGRLSLGAWWALRILLFGAVIYSAAFSAFAAINHDGKFAVDQPAPYAALERFFNAPVLAWEKLHPGTYGPVEMTVRFPMNRPGIAEPILVTGVSFSSDYLYAVYSADGRHLQLGFSHTNYDQRMSQPIAIDYRVPHTIGIQMGSLYPAETHPFFSAWAPAAIQAAKHTLTVTLDGVPYLSAEQDFFDTTPGFVKFGANDVSEFTARKFSGQILAVERQPLPPAMEPLADNAFIRLGLVLPTGQAGRREPLIATGKPGASDLLFIEYQDGGQVRFGLEHSGQPVVFSHTFPAAAGETQVLEASLGSFYDHPRNSRERELAGTLFVRWNAQIAWVERHEFYPGDSTPPVIGSQGAALSAIAPEFTGRIVARNSVSLLPVAPDSAFEFAPYWIETGEQPAYGAVRMQIELPTQITTPADPLLVTGPVDSQGDFVSITYPFPGQIGFGYLQPGTLGPRSRHFPAAPGTRHTVEIDMPSLYPPESDAYFATRTVEEIVALKQGRLRMTMDRSVVFNAMVPHCDSTADQITPGENHLSDVYGPSFTGKILTVERPVFAPPSGMDANTGPLEMILTLPGISSGKETLLATGPETAPNALVVNYEGPGRCYLAAVAADGHSIAGDPVSLDAAAKHIVLIQWGGFYQDAERRHRTTVSVDSRPVLSGSLDFQFGAPQKVSIGNATRVAPAFSGRLQSIRRLPGTSR
jgi:hypothetical protein